ncbi:MAG: PAS domain-containing protein [Sulfuricurvum sp.]|nr:PAS domain-containing protein [Sulfuricurvum sp.]
MSIYTSNGNERVLSQQAFLVSETDETGTIVFANDDFCKIAGYNIDELIGKPHNMVRHPDMPKAAFKDLWETVKRGETWTGFVKNNVKGGSEFYWVYATVYPVLRNGKRYYMSCRKKPVADEIASSIALYKTLV